MIPSEREGIRHRRCVDSRSAPAGQEQQAQHSGGSCRQCKTWKFELDVEVEEGGSAALGRFLVEGRSFHRNILGIVIEAMVHSVSSPWYRK